jgi:hypothetical protein
VYGPQLLESFLDELLTAGIKMLLERFDARRADRIRHVAGTKALAIRLDIATLSFAPPCAAFLVKGVEPVSTPIAVDFFGGHGSETNGSAWRHFKGRGEGKSAYISTGRDAGRTSDRR